METRTQRLARIDEYKKARTYGPRIDAPAEDRAVTPDPEAGLRLWLAAQRQRLAEIDAKGGARAVREQLRGDNAYIAALDDHANAVRKMTWDGEGDPPDFGPMPSYR